jgi:hypothetical protein
MNTTSSMLSRKVLRLCLLCTLWVGLAASIGYAECSPASGYGTDGTCLTGDACGEICGTTTNWCIKVTCAQNLQCLGVPSVAVQCVFGKCYNPLTNCIACGG